MPYEAGGGTVGTSSRQPSRTYTTQRSGERASQSRRAAATRRIPKKTTSSDGGARRTTSSRGMGGQRAPRIAATRSGQYSRPRAPSATTSGPIRQIIPDIGRYLGSDAVYQNEQRQFGKTLADFLADVGRKKGQIGTEFGLSKKELGEQRLRDLKDIEADYASRGLIKSGLYGERVGEYEKEFGQRSADLGRRQTQSLQDLTTEETQFKREQELQRESSKQAAARRRAQRYGL